MAIRICVLESDLCPLAGGEAGCHGSGEAGVDASSSGVGDDNQHPPMRLANCAERANATTRASRVMRNSKYQKTFRLSPGFPVFPCHISIGFLSRAFSFLEFAQTEQCSPHVLLVRGLESLFLDIRKIPDGGGQGKPDETARLGKLPTGL